MNKSRKRPVRRDEHLAGPGDDMPTRSHRASMVDVNAPPVRLLAKLGSIIVHVEEGGGAGGHEFDWMAARSLIADREVQEWLEGMRAMSLLPVKR